MFRFIVFILLIYLIYKIVNNFRKIKPESSENSQYKSPPAVEEDLVEDPVCHTYVPLSQAYRKEISGKEYYFCSQQCCEKYISEKNN